MTATPEMTTRRAATQRRLIASAVELFAQRGVHGASVEQICDGAGFTRGAFYSNFTTKDDLYLAVVRKVVDRTVDETRQALESVAWDDPDPFRGAARRLLSTLYDDRDQVLVAYALRLYAARETEVRERFLAIQREAMGRLATSFEATLARTGSRFRVNPADAVAFVMGMLERAAMDALVSGADAVSDDRISSILAAVRSLTEHADGPA